MVSDFVISTNSREQSVPTHESDTRVAETKMAISF